MPALAFGLAGPPSLPHVQFTTKDRCAPFGTASSTGLRRAGELIILSVNVRYGERRPAAQGRTRTLKVADIATPSPNPSPARARASILPSAAPPLRASSSARSASRLSIVSRFPRGSPTRRWPNRPDTRPPAPWSPALADAPRERRADRIEIA